MIGLQTLCCLLALSAQPPGRSIYDEIEDISNQGRTHLKKKDYDRAIDEYTRAIDLNTVLERVSMPSLFLERGIAYGAKKDSDNAIGDFSEAIAIHMTYGRKVGYRCPQAYFHRGMAYFARQKYHLG